MEKFVALEKKLVYGIQYYRAPTPGREHWRRDLAAIRKMGFNAIQLRAQWRWHERAEGQFAWDDLDELFDLGEKNDLRIVFHFMLETAPAWLYRAGPCARIDLAGQEIAPGAIGAFYVGGWLPCFDQPLVREKANRFIRAAAQRYQGRKNLLLWNIWNEPRSRPGGECCCAESRRRYRQWLQGRFKTIGNLNRAFGKAWGHWEEIDPPAMIGDYAETYLWRQWAMASVADRLAWVRDQVKKTDPARPVMTHVGMCAPYQDILNDTSLDSLNAKTVDFYGSSLPYWTGEFHGMDAIEKPASFAAPNGQNEYYVISLIGDYLRSISAYFWINEIYTNAWHYTAPDFSPDDLKFWAWTMLAGGAKGLLFWQYRPEIVGDESVCAGLVDLKGRPTPRSQAVARLAQLVKNNAKIFSTLRPAQAEIGLVYDFRSDLISRIEDTTPDNRNRNSINYRYKQALKGIYALFWKNNLPVDFISSTELQKIKAYKLIYLPCPIMLAAAQAAILKDYVKAGGFLISELGPGFRRENTWIGGRTPAYGLDKIFGCEETLPKKAQTKKTFAFEEIKLAVTPGRRTASYRLRGAQALATWEDGAVAMALNQYGRGAALILGMHPGQATALSRDDGRPALIRRLAKLGGVTNSLRLENAQGLVLSRTGHSAGGRMVFLFNYENVSQDLVLRQIPGAAARDLAAAAEIKIAGHDLHIKLPPRAVACLLLSPSKNNARSRSQHE